MAARTRCTRLLYPSLPHLVSPRLVAAPLPAAAIPVLRRQPLHSPGQGHLRRWYSVSDADSTPIWSFERVQQHLDQPGAHVHLVDVREPDEVDSTGKIPRALVIPMSLALRTDCFGMSDDDFVETLGFARPPRNQTLVFYCAAGIRAAHACRLARLAGWENVAAYKGSMNEWLARRGPVERLPGKGAAA
ncbi:hypothetical protein CDD81_7319 [Ophiocordyceps australis]|uniref:Rhodanese domain-containing protein n=1 Tax=Ophiocordyceps australis TaxID=1399860 RepID=A0A2C5X916_9HYPO|nr:hypothetical protein CDD81_7319 [Ophiocordyceps australis]